MAELLVKRLVDALNSDLYSQLPLGSSENHRLLSGKLGSTKNH